MLDFLVEHAHQIAVAAGAGGTIGAGIVEGVRRLTGRKRTARLVGKMSEVVDARMGELAKAQRAHIDDLRASQAELRQENIACRERGERCEERNAELSTRIEHLEDVIRIRGSGPPSPPVVERRMAL